MEIGVRSTEQSDGACDANQESQNRAADTLHATTGELANGLESS